MKSTKVVSSFSRINRVKPLTNICFSAIMMLAAVLTVIPILLVFTVSISSGASITRKGFSYIPAEVSFVAYETLFKTGSQLVDSYLITIASTLLSTFLGLTIMSMLAFVLAQERFPCKGIYTFLLFFTTLFSGGLVPSYIINVRYLHLYDSFWILVLPSMLSAFNVFILRTFINSTIPTALFDAAKIDGANDFTVYFRIVLPLFKAGLATIGLFCVVGKWNEWFTGMLYIENPKLVPLQTVLTRIQQKIDFIKNNSSYASTPEGAEMLRTMPTEPTRMAIVVISTLPILFAYPFFQRFFINGLTIGSVKG